MNGIDLLLFLFLISIMIKSVALLIDLIRTNDRINDENKQYKKLLGRG